MNDQEQLQFSLIRYHGKKIKADILSAVVLTLLILLILWTPLPFGSVEPNSIFWINVISILCFVCWLMKLIFFGNPQELARFRKLAEERRRENRSLPFFSRHIRVARLANILTFGKWPRRNQPSSVEFLPVHAGQTPFPYFSFFGYPVRNTGLELIGLSFLVVLVIQILPLPKFLTWLISPAAREFYETAASAAGFSLNFHPLSLNAYSTLSRLFQYTAYFLLYLVMANSVRTRSAYRAIVYAIIVSVFFQTTYGVYQLLSGQQHIFGYQKKIFLESASGTFINRNHFCAYIGMSLPLLMALLFSTGGMIKPSTGSWQVRMARMLENQSGKTIFRLILIGCVAVGVFFSFSLTGVVAVVLACLMFLVLYQRMRKKSLILLLCAFVTIAGIAGFLGSAFLQKRLGGIEFLSERSRFMAMKDTARIFFDFPISGTGSGTFAEIFPAYRAFSTNATFSHAHNEPVEFLAENGMVVLFFFFVGSGILISRITRIVKSDSFTGMQLFQIGSFSSVLMLALHNLVDFSFEIPAVAVAGVIILGLFYANYHEKSETV